MGAEELDGIEDEFRELAVTIESQDRRRASFVATVILAFAAIGVVTTAWAIWQVLERL